MSTANETGISRHPKGSYVLFATEMVMSQRIMLKPLQRVFLVSQ
jgi:hypothetical protein